MCFLVLSTLLMQIPQITSAPPPTPKTYSTTLESSVSTYVYEFFSTKNYNSGSNQYYLYVGGDEAVYNYVSYVKFDLSSLPDDADVLEAEILLYSSGAPSHYFIINMHPILETWVQSTVNWNSDISYYTEHTSLNVSQDGWHEWDATSIVQDWVDGSKTNYGVAFEADTVHSLRFSSDDSLYKPQITILYKTLIGDEPEDPPEEPPEDTTPCEYEYTITPENPQSGDTVTIEVNATDDVAMQYISIQKGGEEVEYCEATGTQTELSCSYSEVLAAGNYTFVISADDMGGEPSQGETIYVDVSGTGSDPIATLDIEFETDGATPAKYRLLPMDGQRIDITATATDPDGIDFMTITCDTTPIDFSYDPPQTEVEETITFYNGVDVLDDCSAPCTLRYSVRAYDIEDRSTRVEGEDIEVGAPWQWYWGLPFANWGCDENHTWSWNMMESIFGDEVWWNEEYGWRKPHADYLFQNKVRTGGRGGQCYGMCALSLELASTSSDIYANMIQPTAVSIDDLERENWDNTWPYYYARQAGQYSFHRLLLKSAQYLLQPERSGSGLHPFIDDILDQIIDDLNAGTPGIISIFEGSHGHAVVPWRVVPLGGDMYNVYIYDPNHNYTSTHDSTDYTNFNQYPYIVFGEDGWARDGWWSYQWNSSSTWNENIYYTPYDTAIGNPSSKNYIGTYPTTVGITDQKLPDPLQTLMYGSGDASFYAEDPSGRKTGYVAGELISEIPYSAPLFESDGDEGTIDMFMIPSNITFTVHMESTIESEGVEGMYSMMIWHNTSFYAVENVTNTKDTEDEVTFSPRSSSDGPTDYSLRFRRGDVTKLRASDPMDYSIHFAKEYYNSPFVGREYIFTSGQNDEGAEVELYVSTDHDDLVVETYDLPFDFTVTTKSTESLEDDPQIDYIPESEGDFSMDSNEKMAITPDDWETTSTSGSFTTGEEQDDTADSDEDGLSDEDEQEIGSDSTNSSDVTEVEDIDGYLVDTDKDGNPDKFFNDTTSSSSDLIFDEGIYKIDVDGDGIIDFLYDAETKTITLYNSSNVSDKTPGFEMILGILALLLISIIRRRKH